MGDIDVQDHALRRAAQGPRTCAVSRAGPTLGPARLAVALTTLAVSLLAMAGLVNALGFFDRRADDHSSLAYLDFVYGHGYRVYRNTPPSLFRDRDVVEYAKAAMPPEATYRVVVGRAWKPGWTTPWSTTLEADFLLYHLLPRRQTASAPWVFCFSCDLAARGELEVLIDGRGGLSFGRTRP